MNRRKLIKGMMALPVVALLPDASKYITTRNGHRLPIGPMSLDLGTDDWTMEYFIKGSSTADFRFTLGTARYTSRFTPPTDRWTHFVAVKEDGVITEYVDGEVMGV